jgi:hypothetical protein
VPGAKVGKIFDNILSVKPSKKDQLVPKNHTGLNLFCGVVNYSGNLSPK